MFKLIVVLGLALLIDARTRFPVANSESAEKDEIPVCQSNSPTRDKCIKDAIQTMLPRIAHGMPSLNIPAIDPYVVDSTNFKYRNGGIINGRGSLSDLRIFGLSSTQIKSVSTNIDDNTFEADIEGFAPNIFLDSSFKFNGTFESLRLKTEGRFNTSASKITFETRIIGNLYERDGNIHLQVTQFDMKPIIDHMKFHIDGLFADKLFNDLTNEVINQNWQIIYQELLPESKAIWEPILIDECNKLLAVVPISNFLDFTGQSIVNQ